MNNNDSWSTKNGSINGCQEDSLDKFSLRISEPPPTKKKKNFVKTVTKADLVDVSSSSHQTTYRL